MRFLLQSELTLNIFIRSLEATTEQKKLIWIWTEFSGSFISCSWNGFLQKWKTFLLSRFNWNKNYCKRLVRCFFHKMEEIIDLRGRGRGGLFLAENRNGLWEIERFEIFIELFYIIDKAAF